MNLCFPSSILNQHLAVLGKTGAGKSSALRHIVEHLLTHKKRVCIIDPKGDWWGLKASADGKGAGFPIIAFGDFKNPEASDVAINAQSGKHVAELIAAGNRPCVIGFRGWMTSHMVRFWIDFASTLFNANSGELYLVGDEFHNFAPKGKIMDPEAGKCLHWSNRIMSEGRGIGLVCLIASQRPQKVHNDTLTSCETLVAMRVIHAADRTAVKEWIDGCGDAKQGREVLDSLAGLPRGNGFVWSPEVGFGPDRIAFPMFTTFDSFAPPQLQKKVTTAGWADVDLAEVKEKLAAVIEEAKANDPKELKAQLAEAKRELNRRDAETPVLGKDELARLELLISKTKMLRDEFEPLVNGVAALTKEVQFFQHYISAKVPRRETIKDVHGNDAAIVTHLPRPLPRIPANPNGAHGVTRPTTVAGNGDLKAGERKVMIAAAQYPEGVSRETLKVLTGFRATSLYEYSRLLVQRGYVDARDNLILPTPAGIEALGTDYEPLPTGNALVAYWRGRLSGGELKIFELLVANGSDPVSREQIMEALPCKSTSCYEFTRLLKSRRVVIPAGGTDIVLAKEFFE